MPITTAETFQPLALMTSLPLTLIGVVLALMMFGSALSLFSVIGVIMLMGLVTKNAILLVDFAIRAREDHTGEDGQPVAGMSRHDALLMAAPWLGLGIALLPCFLASREPGLVPVLPDVVDVTRDFWLVAPAERRELARIKALWDYLRRVTDLNQDFLMGQSAEIQWVP